LFGFFFLTSLTALYRTPLFSSSPVSLGPPAYSIFWLVAFCMLSLQLFVPLFGPLNPPRGPSCFLSVVSFLPQTSLDLFLFQLGLQSSRVEPPLGPGLLVISSSPCRRRPTCYFLMVSVAPTAPATFTPQIPCTLRFPPSNYSYIVPVAPVPAVAPVIYFFFRSPWSFSETLPSQPYYGDHFPGAS